MTLQEEMASILRQLQQSSDDKTSKLLAQKAWTLYDANPRKLYELCHLAAVTLVVIRASQTTRLPPIRRRLCT